MSQAIVVDGTVEVVQPGACSCGHRSGAAARFCAGCGKSLEPPKCGACGAEASGAFCASCGASLEAKPEPKSEPRPAAAAAVPRIKTKTADELLTDAQGILAKHAAKNSSQPKLRGARKVERDIGNIFSLGKDLLEMDFD